MLLNRAFSSPVRIHRFYIKLSVRKRRLTFIIRKHLPMVIAQDAASLPEILSRWCHIVFPLTEKGKMYVLPSQTNAHITSPFLKMCSKNFRIIFVGIDDSSSTIHWSQFPGKLKTFWTIIFLLSQHITRISPSQALDAILFMTLLWQTRSVYRVLKRNFLKKLNQKIFLEMQ